MMNHVTDPSPSHDPSAGWRTLPTVRGAFILPWQPAALKHLLRAEGLAPADLAVGGTSSTHALARDLFLLGLRDEMECSDEPRCRRSPISSLARDLLSLIGCREARNHA
jgi:hypothetical protein